MDMDNKSISPNAKTKPKKETCEKHKKKAQRVRELRNAMNPTEKKAYDKKKRDYLRHRRAQKKPQYPPTKQLNARPSPLSKVARSSNLVKKINLPPTAPAQSIVGAPAAVRATLCQAKPHLLQFAFDEFGLVQKAVWDDGFCGPWTISFIENTTRRHLLEKAWHFTTPLEDVDPQKA
jgi:hypothetical protein